MKFILALINCYLSFIIDSNQVRLAIRDNRRKERYEVEFGFQLRICFMIMLIKLRLRRKRIIDSHLLPSTQLALN